MIWKIQKVEKDRMVGKPRKVKDLKSSKKNKVIPKGIKLFQKEIRLFFFGKMLNNFKKLRLSFEKLRKI